MPNFYTRMSIVLQVKETAETTACCSESRPVYYSGDQGLQQPTRRYTRGDESNIVSAGLLGGRNPRKF